MKLNKLVLASVLLGAGFVFAQEKPEMPQYNVLKCSSESGDTSVSIVEYRAKQYKAIVTVESSGDSQSMYKFTVSRNPLNPHLQNDGRGYSGRGFALRLEKTTKDGVSGHLSVPSLGVRDQEVLCQ